MTPSTECSSGRPLISPLPGHSSHGLLSPCSPAVRVQNASTSAFGTDPSQEGGRGEGLKSHPPRKSYPPHPPLG